ncbi:carboxylate--amine ligase [Halalkalicoccus jeotgali]|uniref:ATP-grasp protein-like protein n=1 Tax=Halalkalicoccus jeotgali (strain DSM 18796 / CECT 7217 / JCM 14584 / KCTC 4019 / B3) TaxID=795797 RepID=D8J478_HALJB|nr:ATP-grasp domain-containing protein [Halalkalicoccus jeotgali]ADJ15470.1 ATP-grasp protein-like protein [Halalkalicoccus jeotgali B3]ELY36121.1 ATP-grasp protein-like protein [Halalkalicoccus jeotgali B3]
MSVVVPGIDTPSSTAVVRSLGRRGIGVIVAEHGESPAGASKYCDLRITVPSPHEDYEGYAEALLALARCPETETVVPLRETDVYALSTRRGEFSPHVATPWPDRTTVKMAQDRLRLFEVARAAGLRVPQTDRIEEYDGWDVPTVIKPRYSVLETEGRLVEPSVRLLSRGSEPDREALCTAMGHAPLVQAYVPGTEELGFFALFDHGRPLATFQHRRRRSYHYTGGASVYREAIDDPAVESAGLALLRALGWHGPAMVEFKRDARDGELVLMEVNPRFWGSLALSIHAGVDFPYHYYRLATDDPIERAPSYETGVASHVLHGELVYLMSLLGQVDSPGERPPLGSELVAVARSLASQPNFDYCSLDDPRPFLVDLNHTARTMLERVRRS